MFFGSPIFGNSPQNINYMMLILGEELMSIDDSVERAIDVTNNAVEFSVYKEGFGFAGTADALLDIDGKGPFIVDWKTAKEARSDDMINQFCHQLGAYSLGLKSLTGIQAKYGAVVVARRSGKPQIKILSELEMRGSESIFLDRVERYHKQLKELAVV